MFFILSCTPYFSSAVTELTPMDIERLTGFAEHKKSERDFDIERNTGYKEWLQGQEDWDRAQKKAAEEFRKLAKEPSPSEDIRAYKDWLDEQEEWNQEQEQARKSFIADRKHLKRPLTEEEELEIYSKRPRYRLKGRTLYNSRATRSRPTGPTQPAHREEPPETAPFTPPPPTPTPPSGDFDFPPPPPPPMDDDFPPPPPPPSFDDFDSDFPPPPPPPPSDFVPDM